MGVARSIAAREAMSQQCAQPASCVMGPLCQRESEPRVVFYRLRRKFVDSEESVPRSSSDIIYYTLAVGHHTGVIDCLEEELACSADEYKKMLSLLPSGSLRRKLEGVMRCGEIQVDCSHAQSLRGELREVLAQGISAPGCEEAFSWLNRFSEMLNASMAEKAVYYMGRLRC